MPIRSQIARTSTWLCVLVAMLCPAPVSARGTQAGSFHVLKIAAGPAGASSNDSFVLTEERSVFNRTDDREVIVAFDWEGAPGGHKLVAVWRSQDGATTSSSAIDYTAKGRRFGAYWRLP